MKSLKQMSRRKFLGPLAVATLASLVLLTQGAHAAGKETKTKVKKKKKGTG